MGCRSRSDWRPLLAGILLSTALTLQADPSDPPTRVARLAYLEGGVSFHPAGAEDWATPDLNQPLTIGDQLWSDRDGRIELQFDGSNVRLGGNTAAGLLNLSDQSTQIQLSSGSLVVHVRQLADDESYEIDTPNIAFSILRPGTYRLTVDGSGGATAVAVRNGQGEAVGSNGTGYTVRAGENDTFAGTDQIQAGSAALDPEDELDTWSAQRDQQYDQSLSARYVSPDVVGYQALDDQSQGNWNDTPDYGHVWFPAVEAGWAPYQFGHWAYVAPWGYTWIDDRPWGFAPFHYGRWVFWRQRWGWVPVPPPVPFSGYVRPVYAPALVAWVGTGATIGWFALAPREVYVPSYPVSRRYLDVVNVSNTRINTTIINNVYNTTIVNHVTVNNVTYANRGVPGAVMTAPAQSLASARPLHREGNLDTHVLANAPVRPFAPAVAPTRAAIYGGRSPAALRPSQAVQTRVTAARMAPAVARVPGGAAPRAAAVRVVPPVRTLVSSRDFENARTPTTPALAAPAGGRPAVHAGDIPPGPRAPSPGIANSVLGSSRRNSSSYRRARKLNASDCSSSRTSSTNDWRAPPRSRPSSHRTRSARRRPRRRQSWPAASSSNSSARSNKRNSSGPHSFSSRSRCSSKPSSAPSRNSRPATSNRRRPRPISSGSSRRRTSISSKHSMRSARSASGSWSSNTSSRRSSCNSSRNARARNCSSDSKRRSTSRSNSTARARRNRTRIRPTDCGVRPAHRVRAVNYARMAESPVDGMAKRGTGRYPTMALSGAPYD